MKQLTSSVAGLFACLAMAGLASADNGYWFGADAEPVRSGAGECVHTGSWSPDMAIVGCDGKEAAEAPPPAPPPAPIVAAPVTETVTFGFDSADLEPAGRDALDGLVQRAGGMGSVAGATLVGHTDRVGTDAYNLDLSLRRADAVSRYLVDAGMDPQAIEITGKGEMEPLVACEDERGAAAIQCLAPNRRVEVELNRR